MRTLLPLVVAAGLAGCNAGNGDVYLIHIPNMTNYDCVTEISENFVEGNAPEEDAPTADWIFENTSKLSDQLVFAQIVGGKKDAAYMVIQDQIYPGVKSSDGYTFEWTGSDTSTDSEQFVPSTYRFASETENSTHIVIKLAPNKAGGLAGTFDVTDTVDESYVETDEWSLDVPYATGQINNYSTIWLVGAGTTNEQDRADCEDEECFLDVVQTCAGFVDITAEQVDYADEGVFDAIEDAEQPAGT